MTPEGPEGPEGPEEEHGHGHGIEVMTETKPTLHHTIEHYLGKPLGTSKRKDVSAGQSYKINVYQDEGFSLANRAKVDLDRDDKWDEKWTWDEGTLSRQLAPADDENYTVTEQWSGDSWQAADSAAATDAVADPSLPSGDPVADAIMTHLGQALGSPKLKDTTSGQSFKVNVYQDEGFAIANRAKVDLDRDDKWDEKWTWDEGTVSRQIAPSDDENYSVTEEWSVGSWGTPGATAETSAPAADPSVPTGRPMDDAVMAHLGKPLGTSKRKDTTSGQPFKVNVY
jgi:hypothetical protein